MYEYNTSSKIADVDITFNLQDGISLNTKTSKRHICISQDTNGDPHSYYHDNVWDYSVYKSAGSKATIYWDSWKKGDDDALNIKVLDQIKWMLFLYSFYSKNSTLSISTIIDKSQDLKKLASLAVENSVDVYSFFSDEKSLGILISNSKKHMKAIGALSHVLSSVSLLEKKYTNIPNSPENILNTITHIAKKYSSRYKEQYAPLPSRLYLSLINQVVDYLNTYNIICDDLYDNVGYCVNNFGYGLEKGTQKNYRKKHNVNKWKPYSPSLIKLLKPETVNFLRKYDYSTYQDLGKIFRTLQANSKILIHAFSGMRDEEVNTLTFDCFAKKRHNNKELYLISGYTTKFNGGIPKEVTWITASITSLAIEALKKYALFTYKLCDGYADNKSARDYPLFTVPYFLSITARNARRNITVKNFKQWDFEYQRPAIRFSDGLNYLNLDINNEDVIELESIEPHKDWRTDGKYTVGKQWPLCSHQLRRSLALYAQKSGIVSLPSLKDQLKHITNAMTEYYGSGNAQAKNIISNIDDGFSKEYRMAVTESQAVSYIKNVLLTDEQLFGGHGVIVNNRKFNIANEERNNTIKRFKNGEISYKETPLGGCTTLSPCSKKAMRSIVGCLDCKDSVIKISKLKNVILEQETLISNIKKTDIVVKFDMEDLKTLNMYLDKLTNKELKSCQ